MIMFFFTLFLSSTQSRTEIVCIKDKYYTSGLGFPVMPAWPWNRGSHCYSHEYYSSTNYYKVLMAIHVTKPALVEAFISSCIASILLPEESWHNIQLEVTLLDSVHICDPRILAKHYRYLCV